MKKNFVRLLVLIPAVLIAGTFSASAQQKMAYIDSEYILSMIPEYATVQQQLDRMAQEWQSDIEARQNQVDELFRDYQARELLFTNEERQRKREEIMQAEREVEQLRMQYFGPEGELFTQQETLMRPIQEDILNAVEQVATEEGYDYVFDKSGDFLFMYVREQYNLSDQVLEELGIDIESTGRSGR